MRGPSVDVLGARYDSQDPLGSLFGALSFGTPHFLEFVNLVRASQEMKNQIKEAFGKLPESSRRSILKMIKSSVHRDELEEVLGHE